MRGGRGREGGLDEEETPSGGRPEVVRKGGG